MQKDFDNQKKWLSDVSDRIVQHSTVVYGLMIVLSVYVCKFYHENLKAIFSVSMFTMPILHVVLVSLLSLSIMLCLNLLFELSFPSFRKQQNLTALYTRSLKVPGIIYLSFIGAVGEELLFRACVQPSLGILLTSTVVGIFHLGPMFKLSAWTLYGVLRSLLFGSLFYYTGSIIPCLVVHFVLNLFFLFKSFFHTKSKKKAT